MNYYYYYRQPSVWLAGWSWAILEVNEIKPRNKNDLSYRPMKLIQNILYTIHRTYINYKRYTGHLYIHLNTWNRYVSFVKKINIFRRSLCCCHPCFPPTLRTALRCLLCYMSLTASQSEHPYLDRLGKWYLKVFTIILQLW